MTGETALNKLKEEGTARFLGLKIDMDTLAGVA